MPRQGSGRTGRPIGFDPQAAVDRAVELFWTCGYEAATIPMLEQAMTLSRSSMLNTFGPKDRLFLTVLDRYQQMADDALIGPLRTGSQGMADIDRFFTELARVKATAPGSCGCLIVNTAAEHSPATPEVQQRIDHYRRTLSEAMAAALARAAAAGEISATDTGPRADVLAALAIAINWTARAAGGPAAQELATSAQAILHDWRQ